MNVSSLPPSLPHTFLKQAVAHPDRPLLHFEGRTYSYGEVHQHVSETARSLHMWGLQAGDRVALYLENSPSFITAYLSVLWLGGVIVPVNTRYRETELRHMLRDSGARVVVTDQAGLPIASHSARHRFYPPHRVHEFTKPLDTAFSDVTILNDNCAWRAGADDIARIEGHDVRVKRHQVVRTERHV